MTLYERALKICKERGESMEDVAVAIGVGERSLRNWKTSSPKIDTVADFARHFDLSIDYVYYGEQKENALTPDERELLRLYRSASERGQALAIGNLQGSQQDTDLLVG